MKRGAIALVLLALLAGGGLRAAKALNPTGYTSADESAYATLATNLADRGHYGDASTGLSDPLRWSPGAPLVFAAAHKVTGNIGPGAIYLTQAIIGIALILVVFLIAARLGGPWAGACAAVLVALYPPLISATGDVVSEPLGALTLALAILALILARDSGSTAVYLVPGALLGVTILVRTDQILLPGLLAVFVVAEAWRRLGPRRAPIAGAAVAAGTVLALAPWIAYASLRADHFVPVTTGGGAPLFIGTYLPGNGTTGGLKRELGDEARLRNPKLRGKADHQLEARAVLDVVAARHPELPREDAIALEGRKNLVRYGLGDPISFAGMMASKASRMWFQPYDGGRYPATWPWKAWHNLLLALSVAGLAIGIWRTRSPALIAIAIAIVYSTALHSLVVAQPRYNVPLMPLLFAAGAVGWWTWVGSGRYMSSPQRRQT